MRRLCLLLICITFPLSLFAQTPKLPVSAFANLPDVKNVSLSPDGTKLASVVRVDDDKIGHVVSITDLDSNNSTYPISIEKPEYRVQYLRWANNRYLLVAIYYQENFFRRDIYQTRLMIYDSKTGKAEPAFSRQALKRLSYDPPRQTSIIDMLPEDEDGFLIEMYGALNGGVDVYRYDLNKKKLKMVKRHLKNVRSWTTDQQHNIRLGYHYEDGESSIIHRWSEDEDWKTLWSWGTFSDDEMMPLGFDLDPEILYVRAYHDGRKAIFKVNLKDPDLKKELVVSHPKYDLSGGLVYSRKTGEVLGISSGSGAGTVIWSDEHRMIMKAMDNALPDTKTIVFGFTKDEQRFLVYSHSDTHAGDYYLVDRESGSIELVAERYASLAPEYMANTRKLSYKARDGLEIEGYLTLPKDRKDGERVPAIVFPHGGPIVFDDGEFNYWTQFFANRGYAVLQMNFRGSHGYGYDFMKRGLSAWGKEMQDDVADGALWMVEQGYADKDKICIVGGSYGGYAALMGAAKTPDLYKCAVSFAGVTDLPQLVKDQRMGFANSVLEQQIGSDFKDLKERSPSYKADQISSPVLIMHGIEDRVVPINQARRMSDAMKKAGKEFEYYEFEGGNHNLSYDINRIAAFEYMDAFLSKHLSDQIVANE